jgi:hypothetical protein
VPFNELPSELDPDSTPEKVEAEKERIRIQVLNKTNAEIITEDASRPESLKAMTLLRELGSDLNINAFALNFTDKQGKLNDDVEEANYLMQRVIEALSVDSPNDDPTKIPLYLTSTEFSDELYGDCKKHYMKRLGLQESTQDLMVLRNVVMSPFPTDSNFISQLAGIFKDTVEKETEVRPLKPPDHACLCTLPNRVTRSSASATSSAKTSTASSSRASRTSTSSTCPCSTSPTTGSSSSSRPTLTTRTKSRATSTSACAGRTRRSP